MGVDDGRPDVEFDLSGITWSPGQRINYSLSVSPDAIIMLTPEKIVLPPMGGFSQFNVIVENESPKAWAISGTNFYIFDNLADLQGLGGRNAYCRQCEKPGWNHSGHWFLQRIGNDDALCMETHL